MNSSNVLKKAERGSIRVRRYKTHDSLRFFLNCDVSKDIVCLGLLGLADVLRKFPANTAPVLIVSGKQTSTPLLMKKEKSISL